MQPPGCVLDAERLREQTAHICQGRSLVVVGVHEPVIVLPVARSLLDNEAHLFERGTPVVEATVNLARRRSMAQ